MPGQVFRRTYQVQRFLDLWATRSFMMLFIRTRTKTTTQWVVFSVAAAKVPLKITQFSFFSTSFKCLSVLIALTCRYLYVLPPMERIHSRPEHSDRSQRSDCECGHPSQRLLRQIDSNRHPAQRRRPSDCSGLNDVTLVAIASVLGCTNIVLPDSIVSDRGQLQRVESGRKRIHGIPHFRIITSC